LSGIVADIRTDVLPRGPEQAAALAEKVFCFDQKVFERADDSDGLIADELRTACVLWLDAAAALRASRTDGANWAARVYEFYRQNDYGVREPLLEQAHRLLREDELRALASRFEDDARRTVAAANSGEVEHHQVFGASSAMGLVTRALRDPKLYEQSIQSSCIHRSRTAYRQTASPSSISDVAMLPVRCAGLAATIGITPSSSA
jgi:hypothetical protein